MQVTVGSRVNGTVTRITGFGVFVAFDGTSGMIHISQLSDKFVKDINEVVKVGDELECIVTSVDEQGRRALSRKAVIEEEKARLEAERNPGGAFEDMLNKFKTESNERQRDIKKGFEAKRGSSGKRKK